MRFYLGLPPTSKQVLGEIFFVQNYLGGIWNHTWSLAVEEHFYIGLALLVLWLLSANPSDPFRRVPLIFVIIATVCLSFRFLNLIFHPTYSNETYLFPTHIRIDSLMFGVLLSYLWNFKELEKRIAQVPSFVLFLVGMLFISPAFIFGLESHKWLSIGGVVFFYFGAGLLLLAALRWQSTKSFPIRILSGLGAASYSVYLWHMPFAIWGYYFLSKISGHDSYYFYLFNAIVGSCAFGWLLNRLIETPTLMIRDRLFPSQSSAIITSAKI
jgi:peptidoglycan/LPS O-acetylase OafA/YrhL